MQQEILVKSRRPDARIAFAMPPRIGTNIMMVMREDMHHGVRKKQKLRLFLYKFLSSDLLINRFLIMSEKNNSIQELLGQTDIYLVDQIMKNRFNLQDNILDAGCGNGRNMHWFLRNDYKIYGIDSDNESIATLKKNYPLLPADRFRVCVVEKTSFQSTHFDHIISSAVLHFANNTSHFRKMLEEMVRILKPGGSLFIRMTSDIGIEDKVEFIGDGVFRIPDGSIRFLLNRQLLKDCLKEFNMSFLEPLKTVNVDDIRCMSTLVLRKN